MFITEPAAHHVTSECRRTVDLDRTQDSVFITEPAAHLVTSEYRRTVDLDRTQTLCLSLNQQLIM